MFHPSMSADLFDRLFSGLTPLGQAVALCQYNGLDQGSLTVARGREVAAICKAMFIDEAGYWAVLKAIGLLA